MTPRRLLLPGVALALLGLTALHADDPPAPKPGEDAKALVARAIQTTDDLPKAIGLLERAVQLAPKDREALFWLGVTTGVRADEVADKAEKLAMLRKSAAALATLEREHKDLDIRQKAYVERARPIEARILAVEGKPEAALAKLRPLMDAGKTTTEIIEGTEDFQGVVALPAYQEMVRKTLLAELAQNKSFPFDFDLKDASDKPVKLADFRGKVAIVDLWGTWCPPCRQEIPHFVELNRRYGPKGLAIVGINCNEKGSDAEIKKTIREFAAENHINYPCLLNDDKTEEKVPDFEGYPTTLFIDRAGKVRLKLVGYTPAAKLEFIVKTLLDEPAKP